MKKMTLILIWIISQVGLFASYQRIYDIKDLYSVVKETTFINGEEREKNYTIEYIETDYLRKEVTFPNVNKGEIFQYSGNKSLVYIPLFNEVIENKSDDKSNFLPIINNLKDKDKNDKNFIDNYYKLKVSELDYENNYKIKINKYGDVNNFLIPIDMDILERGNKVANIKLETIKINSGLRRKELKK